MIRDFTFESGRLVVRQTGAHIELNRDFFTSVAKAGSFIGEVAAISATRKIKQLGKSSASKRPRLAFVPMVARPWYAIWPVCQLAGVDLVTDPADADLLFYFEDSEHALADTRSALPGLPAPIINGQCLDIRKSHVGAIFKKVFGYNLEIDPLTWHGDAVEKSEMNGKHDGRIVTCPIQETKPGYVYQRLIKNSEGGEVYTDIRTPIVGSTIPTVFLKHRRQETRFTNDNDKVERTTADAMFSPEEQKLILQFAQEIGLEFGGMDILRDHQDGRIYIVDVNKTDMGPPTNLPRTDKLFAMKALAESFKVFAKEKMA